MNIEKLISHPIQLVDIDITDIHCKKTVVGKIENDFKTEMQISTDVVKQSDSVMITIIKFDATARSIENSDLLYSIFIELKGRAEYELINEDILDEEMFKHFAHLSAVRLMWPYLRENISNLTYKMNIPRIDLPTIDVIKTVQV